jgi:serine/threonine-protein kinase
MHDRDRWLALSGHLDHALELPPSERAAWLSSLEREQPELAAEIRSLLSAADQRDFGDFLAGPAPAAPQVPPPQSVIGRRVGPYVIESEIGRGGMGSVWRAVRADGHFEGYVAIKLVHASWLGREGEQRFRREGKLLARLDHPHIARLIDAGVLDDGQPYLVLEYVEGTPIDTYCDAQHLDTKARVKLFIDVLGAVAHAHSHLIVHRDIKPSNILVTRAGSPKLLDFGIAKPLSAEDSAGGLTRSGVSALTPDYAAPEQLLGEPVTTVTDVYTLGLVLYLLLTGKQAMTRESHSTADFIRNVLDKDVPRASTRVAEPQARRALEGDLDNILAKALNKRPAKRYTTADAFADDLKRFLTDQPVQARPDTVTYRVTKFVRRHRGGVTTAILMLVALIVATFVTTTQMIEARRQRDLAESELQRAEAFNDLMAIVLSESGSESKGLTPGELLDRGEKLVRSEFASTPVLRAQLMYTLSMLYLAAGLNGKQLPLVKEANDLAEKAGDVNMIALTGCALAQAATTTTGEATTARASIERFLAALPQASSSDDARADCLFAASTVDRLQGDGARALAEAERGNELVQRSTSATQWGKLISLITLADAERSAGRFALADGTYQRIAAGFNRLNVERTGFVTTLYNNWALVLVNLGQPIRAAGLYERVIEYKNSQGTPDAFLRVNYASALVYLGRAEEARRILEPAYADAVANGNRVSAAMVRMALTRIYRDLGDLDRSDQLLRQTESDLHAMLPEGHEAFGALYLNKALLAQKRQDYASALTEADRAIAIFSAKPGLAYRAATTRTTRAEILLALGRVDEARTDANQSLAALRKLIEPNVKSMHIGRALLVIAQIDAKAGDASASESAAREAYAQLVETIGAQHPLTVTARDLGGYH